MSDNTYQSADTDAPGAVDPIKQILGKIQNGWIAGLVMAIASLVYGVWLSVSANLPAMMLGLILGDALFLAVLSFGIYKKSRISAVFLLIYFLAGRVLFFMQGGNIGGIFLPILFAIFFYQAAHATFQWHKQESL